MAASIFHRATGFILATAGVATLLWWLASIAGGPESYANFQHYVFAANSEADRWASVSNWFFRLLGLAVLYSFFQHMFSGIRHLLMDIGAGFELVTNRSWALAVFIAALTATALVAMLVASRFLGI